MQRESNYSQQGKSPGIYRTVRPSGHRTVLKSLWKKHIFSTESEQYLDVDGERFPYKHMEITPTELRLNVIGGSHFYDL